MPVRKSEQRRRGDIVFDVEGLFRISVCTRDAPVVDMGDVDTGQYYAVRRSTHHT